MAWLPLVVAGVVVGSGVVVVIDSAGGSAVVFAAADEPLVLNLKRGMATVGSL